MTKRGLVPRLEVVRDPPSTPRAPFQNTALAVGALGVVFGDIGTNPLFAFQECFTGPNALAPTGPNVLGVLSLVFWSLVLVVSIKYLGFVMRASNDGEGGILALLALIPTDARPGALRLLPLVLLLGASLLYGDAVVSPAISVLSAMEGLELAAPSCRWLVVPLTVTVLVALFLVQRRGTERIGKIFGPVMIVWFGAIAALGVRQIVLCPVVLQAFDPRWAIDLLASGGSRPFLVLGAVVLAIAGGEALYADLGHFGRRPIAVGWYSLVLPALVASYFGQGAHVLGGGEMKTSAFYAIVPEAVLYPMIALATFATVIASQGLITGMFSLTQQAIQLGTFPRVPIVHTSAGQIGQIYVPFVNALLMIGCVVLVIAFGASERLAGAYGLAVTGTMTITSIGFFVVLTRTWRWRTWRAVLLVGAFLVFDLAFLVANLPKFLSGGWVPVAIALVVFVVMTTWMWGRQRLAAHLAGVAHPMDPFVREVAASETPRVPGTGVFMTANPTGVPPVLLHHFKHNHVLHERVVLLSIQGRKVPYVAPGERLEIHDRGAGITQVVAHVGFMETPDVPRLLGACEVDPARASFYFGRETLLPTRGSGLGRWRKQLFAFLTRNAQSAPGYFGVPPHRVVELGWQIEI